MRFNLFLILFFFSTLLFARSESISSNLSLEPRFLSEKEFLHTREKLINLSEVVRYTLGECVNQNKLLIIFTSNEQKPILVRKTKEHYELKLPKIMVHDTLSNESLVTIIQGYLLSCYTSKKLPPKVMLNAPILPEWFCAAIFYRTQAFINAPLQRSAIHPLMVNFFEKYPNLIPLDPQNAVMLPISPKSDLAYQIYAEWCDLILRYHFAAIPQTLNKKIIIMLDMSRTVKNPNASSVYMQHLGEYLPTKLSFSPAEERGISKTIPFASFVNYTLFQYDFHRQAKSIITLYKNLSEHLLYAEKIENSTEYTLKHMKLSDLPQLFDCLYNLAAFKRYYVEQSYALRLQASLPMRQVLYKIEQLVSQVNEAELESFSESLNTLENELRMVEEQEKKRSDFFKKIAEESETINILKNAQLIYYFDTFSRTTQEKEAQDYFNFVERQFLYMSNGKN